MISNEEFFQYLQLKLKDFVKVNRQGKFLFTCPNLHNHKFPAKSPSMEFLPNSDKMSCLICGYKGNKFDCVRLLEPEKKNLSDAEITAYLIDCLHLNIYTELDEYIKYGWSLIPIMKNSKNPFEKDWINIEHKDKVNWIKWLNSDLNLGLNCNKSNIMVVDVDSGCPNLEDPNYKELLKLLEDSQTLKQKTPNNGFHYLFKIDNEIPQTANIAGLKIDTRTAQGQIVIAPSIINGIPYKWVSLGVEIKKMSEELKKKLLELMKVEVSRRDETFPIVENNNVQTDVNCLKEGEGRNSLLVSLGGAFINKFNTEDTAYILGMISRNFFKPPLPEFEIKNMLKKLGEYKASDEESQERIVYEYLKLIQSDVSAKDIIESTKLPRAIVDKWLSKFVKEGKAIRLGRGRYQYKEKIEWSDKTPEIIKEYEYKVPFFNDIAIFQDRDCLILGGKTNEGKTTIALNMVREMVEQGIKPFYIYSESGSRFQKTSQLLGIAGKYYHSYHANPLVIELEYNAFSIIDWLHLEHKENTDTILKHLNDELARKGGILVIFTQLKQNYEFFAPNMIDQYPTFAARYIQDNDSHSEGHFDISKIKEPRGNYTSFVLPCTYDHQTRIFQKKNII